jgi:hypothetical protein
MESDGELAGDDGPSDLEQENTDEEAEPLPFVVPEGYQVSRVTMAL